METKKIAVACAIGGVLCSAVALIFSPVYWWFGLIAGMAGGYISYEFREVREAIPVALRAARKGGANMWDYWIEMAKEWLGKPHPFFYPAAVIAAPIYVWGLYSLFDWGATDSQMGVVAAFVLSVIAFPFVVLGFVEATWAVIAPFAIFAFIGARVSERCYWWPPLMSQSPSYAVETLAKLKRKELQRMSMSYSNAYRWTAKGFGLTVFFLVWTMWKYLVISIWATLCFFGRFAKHLFKLVHSKKRVLCAVDGTLGGAVSYICLASASVSWTEQLLLIVFGGFLGAAFGVLNWEIVSKRILHVKTNTA